MLKPSASETFVSRIHIPTTTLLISSAELLPISFEHLEYLRQDGTCSA